VKPTTAVPNKRKGCMVAIILIVGFIVLTFALIPRAIKIEKDKESSVTESPVITSESKEEAIDLIIDVTKFNGITSEQLINLIGGPDDISELKYKHDGKKYKSKIYKYPHGMHDLHYEFSVVDDIVTRITVYSKKYYDNDESDIYFKDEDNLFKMFNVVPSSSMDLIAKTPMALRYENVSDEIFELYANGIEMEDNKAFLISVTFDERYSSRVALNE